MCNGSDFVGVERPPLIQMQAVVLRGAADPEWKLVERPECMEARPFGQGHLQRWTTVPIGSADRR